MTAFSASTATLPVVAPSTTIPLRRAPHLWAGVVLFIAFPEIITWLPQFMD